MKKLSKEKRSQLALVTVIIALIGTGLYMGLIRYQQARIRILTVEKEKATKKLNQISETFRNSGVIEAQLEKVKKQLESQEEDMVSDDLYASMINTLRKFKLSYNVNIKQFDSHGQAKINLFSKFPYQQFTVSIMGSAHYHDLGRFIADFENQFRTSRILNLELLPENSENGGGNEELMFRMEIVSLVKATGTPTEKQ